LKNIVFTSGLPRSGSTLFTSILNQNPKFDAMISNPLNGIFDGVLSSLNNVGSYSNKSNEQIDNILRNIAETFHDAPDKTLYFNHNRSWCNKIHILKRLYPDLKLIVLVRDIGWILDSFERLYRKNPYHIPIYFKENFKMNNVFTRCEVYMESLINPVYYGVRDMFWSGEHNFLSIHYDDLVIRPEVVMRNVYNYIEQPYYEHDYNNVTSDYDQFDRLMRMPDMHNVRSKVEYIERKTVIPPEIFNKFGDMNVWKN